MCISYITINENIKNFIIRTLFKIYILFNIYEQFLILNKFEDLSFVDYNIVHYICTVQNS